MEQHGYLGFFTLDEARERAAGMHERCREAGMRTRNTLSFSHSTRLDLSGMTARLNYNHRYDENMLHATVDSKGRLTQLAGVKHHYCASTMERTMLDDLIGVVSVEHALCQIAQYVDDESMVVALDWATCRNKALRLSSKERLLAYADKLGRFQGCARFRRALELCRENTDSPQETLLRLESQRRGLPELAVNLPIALPLSGRVVHVDMAYPEDHVILEYDGRYHYDMSRWEADIEKRNNLDYAGWRTFPATRLTFATKRNLDEYFTIVGSAIAEYRNNGRFL